MKKQILFISLAFLLIIILIPIGIDYLIIGNDFYSNISNSDWVQFLGSYIGSLIGASAGIIGIVMTIMFSRDQAHKEREFLLGRDREERRLSIAPLFLVGTDNKNKQMFDSKFIFNLDGEKSNTPFNVMLEITNVGLGNAVDFELRFVSYGGEDLRQSLLIKFVKIDSPERVSIDFSIFLPELPDDINEHLDKTAEGFLYPNNFLKKYQYNGSTVKTEITYKDMMGNKYCQELHISIQTGFYSGPTTGNRLAHTPPIGSVRTHKAKYVNE